VSPTPASPAPGRPGGSGDSEDQATTTGTGTSEEFVGRVSGQDAGDDRESGAEARADRG
jgi:hypothetical protein